MVFKIHPTIINIRSNVILFLDHFQRQFILSMYNLITELDTWTFSKKKSYARQLKVKLVGIHLKENKFVPPQDTH